MFTKFPSSGLRFCPPNLFCKPPYYLWMATSGLHSWLGQWWLLIRFRWISRLIFRTELRGSILRVSVSCRWASFWFPSHSCDGVYQISSCLFTNRSCSRKTTSPLCIDWNTDSRWLIRALCVIMTSPQVSVQAIIISSSHCIHLIIID